jgi:predicted MFS family arabinose efflux permease
MGALVLGRVSTKLSSNGLLGAAGALYAAALAVIILVPSSPAALTTLVFAGLAWVAVTSTLQAELQLVLPDRGPPAAWSALRKLLLATMYATRWIRRTPEP